MSAWFLFFGIVSLLFSSCQSISKDTRKQTLRINLNSEPQTLDPRKARDVKDQTVLRMLFEGLTRVGRGEKVELAAAKEVSISADLKTYTFTLRPAYWSNGDPVTSKDFLLAWKKTLDPQFPSDYANQLYVIQNAALVKQGKLPGDSLGVRALDDATIEVTLEKPTPYFLELLSLPCFFPVHQKFDVSNGPFVLDEWRHQDFLAVKKNPTYWDAASVSLDCIKMVMVNEETDLKMFEKGDLDWAGSPLSTLPVDALKELKEKKLVQVQPILGTHFLRVNVEKKPFHEANTRLAFALAIQRKAIVEHVTQGGQVPATGLIPLSMKVQKEPYFRDGDREIAGALFHATLKEAPEITLTYAMSERNHLLAQALQEQWRKAFGVQIKLEAVERKIYFDRISKQDYQIALGSWLADFNDPVNFLEVFKTRTSSTNNTNWEDATYKGLLDATLTSDVSTRQELFRRSEQILIDAMPVIPIFHYTLLYLKNPKLHGEVLTSLGQIDFKWARFDD